MGAGEARLPAAARTGAARPGRRVRGARGALAGCLCLAAAAAAHAQSAPAGLMTAADLRALPAHPADQRVPYGPDPEQYGELRLPAGPGPHPVVVLVHGGCWRASSGTVRDLAPMGDALKAEGIATWNIEYRRPPQPGGGWPGTYLDAGRAVDHLRAMAEPYALDLGRVVVVGHSTGGHLAMWIATRRQIAKDSPLFTAHPLRVRGVINMAGAVDMADNVAHFEAQCREPVVTRLLGGTPAAVPDRYRQASAIDQLPLGVPQVLVWGAFENFVPRPQADKYVRAARRAGDRVGMLVVPSAGHFEAASPKSAAWPVVQDAIRSMLGGQLPAP